MSALPDAAGLRAFQAAFAARIRDPRDKPRLQGIPARRMRVYEQLLFNNLDGFLRAAFPITYELLGMQAWRGTARRFFAEHRCRAPLFRDLPREFLDWMEPRAATLFPDRPCLYAFMHYEWLELDVAICPDESATGDIDPLGDLLTGVPVLEPAARLARYHYPVHRIGPGFEPTAPDSRTYCFLVFRDGDDAVRFISLNAVSARLVEILVDGHVSGRSAMQQVAHEFGLTDAERVIEAGSTLLTKLRLAGAVSGIRRVT